MTRVSGALFLLTLLTSGSTVSSSSCTWTKVLPDGEEHHMSLRMDLSSPRLVHSVWSPARVLQRCAFSDHQASIGEFLSLCQEQERTSSPHRPLDVTPELLLDEEESCSSVDSALEVRRVRRQVRSAGPDGDGGGSEVKGKARVRRGFIVPGTLWCGSGNKAPSSSDLGVFSMTDKCCREHDQCQDTILSLHYKFGVFNSNIFTMSHCDCDNRFHSCLKDAQDSISDVVGYTFFNLLKMHCFEFSHKLQCTERNWFGMCIESKMALYAEVHPPTLYVTDAADVNATSHNTTMSNTTMSNTTMSTTMSNTIMSNTTSSIMSNAMSNTTSNTVSTVHSTQILSLVPTEPTAATHSTHTSLISPTNMNTPMSPSRSPNKTLLDDDIPEEPCAVYKYLDECRNKILPLQRKYGFRNHEPRTMYHCNCTHRLFQSLAAHTSWTEALTLPLAHVSQSCFVLEDCTSDQTCRVAVAQAPPPQVQASSSAHVDKQRPLQAMELRGRRLSLKRATNTRSARLHRLCLRVVHKLRRYHIKQSQRKKPE